MADVFIAAGPGEDAQARGLAEALATLGFEAAAGTPGEGDVAKTAEEAKCVIALWSRAAVTAPWITALAVLALDRKKLISAEFESGTTPAPFKAAPKVELLQRDRNKFKARFQALIGEIEKLSETKHNAEAIPNALMKARVGLMQKTPRPGGRPLRTLGLFAAGVAALFAIGFGAGRLVNAVRSGQFQFQLASTPQAEAAATPTGATTQAETPALSSADLATTPWRDVAAQIDAAAAADIRRNALAGDAGAQTLACLGHMAGAADFLPSPMAALEYCNAASAQRDPAGLYLSYVLQRTSPHAGINAVTARERLAQSAQLGWTAAQIDYASVLAPDWRAPLAAQAEAGRLWLAAAERGDARGQFFYARWLRDSLAGPRDPAAAIPYLERAAASGQADAQHMLGTLYRDGIGVARNEARARAMYEAAADQNNTASMFNLADMLRGGTPADRARAVALYQQLACMRDERQIQPLSLQRLRALQESATCR